jgi:hypothetical protein
MDLSWTNTLTIIEQDVQNQSNLFQNNILQNTQTLELFTMIIETEIIYKSNKMPSLMAWVERPRGLN